MWTKETIVLTLQQKGVQLTGVSVVSAGLGAGFTHILLNKTLAAKYAKIAADEIDDARQYVAVLHKEDKYSDPANLVAEYAQQVENFGYAASPETQARQIVDLVARESAAETIEKVEEAVEELHENIFNGPGEVVDIDYNEEMLIRVPNEPYLISQEEFFQNDQGYETATLTYYEADDTLADTRDEIVPDQDATIGLKNLNRFGHGSNDRNIVYVQNDSLDLMFEVIRSEGSYVAEVHGIDERTIRHSSDRRSLRKFRGDDE